MGNYFVIIGIALLVIILSAALHMVMNDRKDLREELKKKIETIKSLRGILSKTSLELTEMKGKFTSSQRKLWELSEELAKLKMTFSELRENLEAKRQQKIAYQKDQEERTPSETDQLGAMPEIDYNHYTDEEIAEVLRKSKRDFAIWIRENGFFMSSRDIKRFINYEQKTSNRSVVLQMLIQKEHRLRGAGSTLELMAEDRVKESVMDGDMVV